MMWKCFQKRIDSPTPMYGERDQNRMNASFFELLSSICLLRAGLESWDRSKAGSWKWPGPSAPTALFSLSIKVAAEGCGAQAVRWQEVRAPTACTSRPWLWTARPLPGDHWGQPHWWRRTLLGVTNHDKCNRFRPYSQIVATKGAAVVVHW